METAPSKREQLEREVRTAATGDVDAVSALVTRFQDRVWAIAYAQLRDVQLAEDAAQEALVDALMHLDQLKVPRAVIIRSHAWILANDWVKVACCSAVIRST